MVKRPSLSQIAGFLFLCLIVGVMLDFAGVTPLGFWQEAWSRVSALALWTWQRLDSLIVYILLGAAVVVPVYVIVWALRSRRRR